MVDPLAIGTAGQITVVVATVGVVAGTITIEVAAAKGLRRGSETSVLPALPMLRCETAMGVCWMVPGVDRPLLGTVGVCEPVGPVGTRAVMLRAVWSGDSARLAGFHSTGPAEET